MQLDEHQRRCTRDEKCTALVTNNNVHMANAPLTFNCAT